MLERMGAPVDIMKERLTDNLQRTPRVAGPAMYPQQVAQVFITPRLKRVIDQATEEAQAASGRVYFDRTPDAGHR